MLEFIAIAMALAENQGTKEEEKSYRGQADEFRSPDRGGIVVYGPIQRIGSTLVRVVDVDGILLIEIIG
jgi:hypothetical protein